MCPLIERCLFGQVTKGGMGLLGAPVAANAAWLPHDTRIFSAIRVTDLVRRGDV